MRSRARRMGRRGAARAARRRRPRDPRRDAARQDGLAVLARSAAEAGAAGDHADRAGGGRRPRRRPRRRGHRLHDEAVLLRRAGGAGARAPAHARSATRRHAAAGIELDLLGRKVMRDGVEIALSARSSTCSRTSCATRPALSREQILSAVWGYAFDPGTNIVEVYVSYLRRKLRCRTPAPIVTVRSVGYRLRREADRVPGAPTARG